MKNLSPKDKEKLNKIWDNDYQTIMSGKDNGIPFLSYVFDLHYKLFGEVCSSCPNKISGYIKSIKNLKNKPIMENTNQKFVLKEGVMIPVAGTSEAYSSKNLTDEKAIELLASNENRISLFFKYPEDWKKQVANLLAQKDKKEDAGNEIALGEKKISLETALELLKASGISTRATTVEGVQKFINNLKDEEKALLLKNLKPEPFIDEQETKRSKEDILFDIEKAEQDLEDLKTNSPEGTEAISALKKQIEEFKKELELA